MACSGLGGEVVVLPGTTGDPPEWSGIDLSERVEVVRAARDLPALAFAVVLDGELVALGAAGERARGSGVPVTLHDQWHIGSNGKSMTATVAASLVAEGAIDWDTTVAEVFSDVACHEDWDTVTLADLLHHMGGVPEVGLWEKIPWLASDRDPSVLRQAWVRGSLLKKPVEADRGSFRYTNTGYALAGAMLEARVGSTWEALMQERLFDAVGMDSAGFGPPKLPYNPSGHAGEAAEPIGDSALADNPAVMGPAGTVHLNLQDWGRFAAAHLAILREEPGPFEDEAYRWLHIPPEGEAYAAGWRVYPHREWAGGPAYAHNGSNTHFMAVQALAPERNLAMLCASNFYGEGRAEQACLELVVELAADQEISGPLPEE